MWEVPDGIKVLGKQIHDREYFPVGPEARGHLVGEGRIRTAMERGGRPAGETTNTLEIYWSGLGIAFNGEHTREGYRIIAMNATPVDDTTSDISSN